MVIVPTPGFKPDFAFISYAAADNAKGFVDKIAGALRNEVELRIGEPVTVFYYRTALAGEKWEAEITQALGEDTFLIPILTPSYFKNANARRELEWCLDRETRLGSPRIFPVYLIDTPLLVDRSSPPADPLAWSVAQHQWVDWRKMRFGSFDSPVVLRSISQFAESMLSAAGRRRPAPSRSGQKNSGTSRN